MISFRNKRDKPECTVNVGGVVSIIKSLLIIRIIFSCVQLNFEVEILATKCINNGAPTTFSIYTHGLNDKMHITIQTNCTCSCSKVPRQINSPQCSNHGIYECGVCTCAEGFYGRECECDTASKTVESKIQQCKKYEKKKLILCLQIDLILDQDHLIFVQEEDNVIVEDVDVTH